MTVFNRFLLWPLLLIGHLLAVSLLAWHLLAQINFAYPLGYNLLDIKQHIVQFGPQNRYKKNFEHTSTAEHYQIFAEITEAVQDQGNGLAEINYRLPDGTHTPLMREAEVIHLQDVANLIDIFYWAGWIGGLLWLLLFAYAYYYKLTFPPLKKILGGFIAGIITLTFIVFIIGPKSVFYWLHEQVFPDEHEWFFFYQDSLMTTLMKAPDLFGFIAAILLMVIVLLWALSVWGMTKLLPPAVITPEPFKKKKRKK